MRHGGLPALLATTPVLSPHMEASRRPPEQRQHSHRSAHLALRPA